jgi:hypothetical protein
MEKYLFCISFTKDQLTCSRVFICISTLFFFSCRQAAKQPTVEKALSALTERFSQLPKAKENQAEFYKLIRSVTIGPADVELQLRSTSDTIKNPQSIIIFINRDKQVFGLPLLSNEYRDYWNFLFDTVFRKLKPANTTFQKELQHCIDTLGLNDTLGTAAKVIDEMLTSLLQCRRIYDCDSSELQGLRSYINYDFPEEENDTCQARFKRSWEAIYSEMHPEEFFIVRNAYWDEKNGRIYQFDSPKRKAKLKVGVRVYRQDCIFHPFNL